jgi:DNA processing protein
MSSGPNSVSQALFWQYLTAAELTPRKAWVLLQQLKESDSDALSHLLSHPLLSQAERARMLHTDVKALEKVLEQGVKILTPAEYPKELRNIEYPPPCLFAWGQTECLSGRKVGIVGTRTATTYGKSVARRFAKQLAAEGVVVVSGGAYGIDAAAHQGALEAQGKTIVVMPTGIEANYPVRHASLYAQIRQSGCLLSPFAVASRWQAARPLQRNELIAALCEVILVIEAPEHSGALTTASAAAEYGREVFVVPANIDNKNFRGSHKLLKEGALFLDSPNQVLEFLDIKPSSPRNRIPASRNSLHNEILEILSKEPSSLEKITGHLPVEASQLLTELTALEMQGKIYSDLGLYTIRK